MTVRMSDYRHGRILYHDNDYYMAPMIESYGEYCEGEVDLFKQLIRTGDTVIDAGANIGTHTVVFGRLVGPEGVVIAYEPQRPIYYTLCGTIALNGLWNVEAINAACGSSLGMINVPAVNYDSITSFGGVTVGVDPSKYPVYHIPVMPIDDLELSNLRFIKVDVEGMESDVLRGACKTIKRHRPILYVENDRREKSEELLELMFSYGYDLYWHVTMISNQENNFKGCTEEIFPRLATVMVLGLPSEAGIITEGGIVKIDKATDEIEFGQDVVDLKYFTR